MAPSTSLQSRINAFENMGNQISTSPPRNGARYHAPDSPSILEEPISPEADSVAPIAPFTPPLLSHSRSPSPPNLGRKSSLIDLGDWVVDDGPSRGPWVNGNGNHSTNGKGTSNGSRGVYGKQSPPKPPRANGQSSLGMGAPLINLESPPHAKGVKAPPLPPRKPSITSLKAGLASNNSVLRPTGRSDSLTVDQPHTYPPLSQLSTGDSSRKGPGHAPASSISSFHSVSLSSDGGGMEAEHLGSHIATFPMDQQNSGGDGDSNSLDESFENVSTSSAISPSTASKMAFDWEKAMSQAKQIAPPKLPQRPTSKSPSIVTPPSGPSPSPRSTPTSPKLGARSASSSSSSTTTARRPPPPPPPSVLAQQFASPPPPPSRYTPRSSRASLTSASASDRSSILSTATTTSRTSISTRASTQFNNKLSRPTPVPAPARKRYEAVFVANVIQRRKAEKLAAMKKAAMLSPGIKKNRQAAGWRGLSVDLITNPDDHPLSSKENEDEEDDSYVGLDERMDGMSVKHIWGASKLEKEKLRAIWSECDSAARGSLDRDSFVKGMWRIDEELRRAQFNRQTSRIRQPPPIKNAHPRPILR